MLVVLYNGYLDTFKNSSASVFVCSRLRPSDIPGRLITSWAKITIVFLHNFTLKYYNNRFIM